MIFLIDLLFAKTVLFEKPKDTVKVDKIKKTRPVYQGNLPNYHRNGRQKVEFMALTSDKEELISHLFKDGSTYNIKLISDVYAYRDKETPIIATYKRGQSLITLEGTARLNPDSKTANIIFDKFFVNNIEYNFLAKGYTAELAGDVEADYESNEGLYFAADLLSVATAAYFDSRIDRATNAFGVRQDENSVDNSIKKGASSALIEASNRFKNKSKSSPPYGLISANKYLKMLVLRKGVGK